MDELPTCNIPNCDKEAKYDEKTVHGSWGYLCEEHHRSYGVGIGTKLEKRVKIDAPKTTKIPRVSVPLTLDGIATVRCPHCHEARSVEPDANYTVVCESCENSYAVVSQI